MRRLEHRENAVDSGFESARRCALEPLPRVQAFFCRSKNVTDDQTDQEKRYQHGKDGSADQQRKHDLIKQCHPNELGSVGINFKHAPAISCPRSTGISATKRPNHPGIFADLPSTPRSAILTPSQTEESTWLTTPKTPALAAALASTLQRALLCLCCFMPCSQVAVHQRRQTPHLSYLKQLKQHLLSQIQRRLSSQNNSTHDHSIAKGGCNNASAFCAWAVHALCTSGARKSYPIFKAFPC